MGRALLAVGASLALCFGVLFVVVLVTRSEDRVAVDNLLAERVSRAIALAEERDEPVEIAALTPFEWDEMLLVAPDTPRSVVSRALGFEFKGDLPYDAESGEMLVFVDDGRLRRFADYRGRGRFAGVQRPVDRFTPDTAIFQVSQLVARPAR